MLGVLNDIWQGVVKCVTILIKLFTVPFNRMPYAPAVYAVEDTYQIVWYTTARSIAWAEIDGRRYYDAAAGNIRSGRKIHKVTVPMAVLDDAKSYSVHAQGMYIHQGYFALKGRERSAAYTFRPVDATDGIRFQNISDTHNQPGGALRSAKYFGERLNFVILNGDIANGAESRREFRKILEIAGALAKGEIPIVYARGNHENRGPAAAELEQYAGCSQSGNFYFEVRLGPVWMLVLDCGEDKEDGHREYSGMIDFSAYRAREEQWIDRVLANPGERYQPDGVEYRILVSHIPFNVINSPEPERYTRWAEKLSAAGLDFAIAGHTHTCNFLKPGETLSIPGEMGLAFENAGAYPTIIGSAPLDVSGKHAKGHTTTAVELQPDVVIARLVNQDLEVCDEWRIPRGNAE